MIKNVSEDCFSTDKTQVGSGCRSSQVKQGGRWWKDHWFFAADILLSGLQPRVRQSPHPAVLSHNVRSLYRSQRGSKIKQTSSASTNLLSVLPELSTSRGAAVLELVICRFLSPNISLTYSHMCHQGGCIGRPTSTGETFYLSHAHINIVGCWCAGKSLQNLVCNDK